MMEDLYKAYGEATINLKIWQGKVNQLEQQIAQELNKNGKKVEIKEEEEVA